MRQCQSCAMPLSKDPAGGGTERDGSKSETYCSLCYKDGEFIAKTFTVAKMQDLVEKEMKKQGYGWPMRKLARAQIPQLARWKKRP